MNLLFLGGVFSDNNINDIIKNTKNSVLQYAADALQKSLIKGFIDNNINLRLLNLPYIGSYPLMYKKLYTSSNEVIIDGDLIGYESGFCNLCLLKNISRFLRMFFLIKKNIKHNDTILFVYSIHTPFVLASIFNKMLSPGIKVCLCVPDLPEYMGGTGFVYKALKKIEMLILDKCYKHIDSFVLLTEQMKTRLPINNQSYCVVEGIFNPNDSCFDFDTNHLNFLKKDDKIIFYAGTLAKRYGVMDLVKSFRLINANDYKLIICGEGDSKTEILNATKNDQRIIYLGQRSRKEVLYLQSISDLLVNPRRPDSEFTKYSFPSKTMEYLASGTPTLLYRLEGIPEEYFQYCFYLEKESGIKDFALKIEEILELPLDARLKMSSQAKQFILNKKNPKIQVSKIINILNYAF